MNHYVIVFLKAFLSCKLRIKSTFKIFLTEKSFLIQEGGRHFVDKRGDISWTLLVTSRGQNCPRDVTFLGDFSWTFFG